MLVELADAVAEVSLPEFMLTPGNVCGLTVEAGPKINMNRAGLEVLLSGYPREAPLPRTLFVSRGDLG